MIGIDYAIEYVLKESPSDHYTACLLVIIERATGARAKPADRAPVARTMTREDVLLLLDEVFDRARYGHPSDLALTQLALALREVVR